MHKTCSKILVFVGAIVLCSMQAWAQPKLNSPYSRVGLGDLVDQHFVHMGGMAGIQAAYHHPNYINLTNPASLGHMNLTAFEVGMDARHSWFSTPQQDAKSWSGNLSYLALAFPIQNSLNQLLERERARLKWGMSLALVPYTNVGYNIESFQFVANRDSAFNTFEGTGGSYRFVWGNGFKYKNLSAGINLSYLFGNLKNETTIIFPQDNYYFFNEIREEFGVQGLIWDGGIQYDIVFQRKKSDGTTEPNGKFITFGLYGNSTNSITTSSTQFIGRRNSNFRAIVDTIQSTDNVKANGKLPARLGIGMHGGKFNKWSAGFSFQRTGWDKYENESKPETLNNTWRFSIGGEIIPDHISYNNYWKRIRYRAGLFAGTDPRLDATGEQINYFGITTGFGMPIILPRQQKSFFNLAFEVGQRGDAEVLRELYTRISVGFTLNDDSWFFKRKFN